MSSALRQIWTLYRHEVRCALRERSIVAMSIVVPLVMYPALMWALFAGVSFVQGQAERLDLRIAIEGLPAAHTDLADSLRANERVVLTDWSGSPAEARAAIESGRLDAFLRITEPEPDARGLPDNFRAELAYNEVRDRSQGARAHVESVLSSYRAAWIAETRRDLGVSDPVWADYALVRDDVATPDEGMRFLLGLVVPMLTLIVVALSAFYPAIDATAGERERSTWETLMTVAAPRSRIAAAKYLYVATFGAMGGLLNLIALTLALRWIFTSVGGEGDAAIGGIPLGALLVIAVGTALLGLLVAAGMLVFAIFARTFKEGQSMIMPVYMLMILPALFLQSPDIELTPALALVPIANVALLIREAITGTIPLGTGIITLVSMAISVTLAVAFAQWVMRREEVLLGSDGSGLGTFLKRQYRNRRRQEP